MSNENIKSTNSDPSFWEEKWGANQISFHKDSNHPFLVKHLSKLTQDKPGARIFFPFCGKEVDMAWLASLGHYIVGVEFVQSAVEQFFAENNIKHSVSELKDYKLFTSEDGRIKLYNGDFFNFTTEYEEKFDCVWDRGAFGALPPNLRIKYAEHIQKLLHLEFRYLMEVFDYDPELYPGPPHSVKMEEIQRLYGSKCKVELVDSKPSQHFNKELEIRNETFEKLYYLTNI